jgi:hypothetical protein
VFAAAGEATADASVFSVSVLELATRVVAPAAIDATTFHGSGLHRAVLAASEDLASLGLAHPSRDHWSVRLTVEGRRLLTEGLSSYWPALLTSAPLGDDGRFFLAALCDLSEEEHDTFAVLRENVTSDTVITGLEGDWPAPRVLRIWEELSHWGAARGARVGGPPQILAARPTYTGFVLIRVGPSAELQAVVRELVGDWEGVTVDHKRELVLTSDAQKAELARDVAALANTQVRGPRYLVVGFDEASRAFASSFNPGIGQDRLEDVLATRLNLVPGLRVSRVPWSVGGEVGLIEVVRVPLQLPYTISRDLTAKIHDGDVFVRHGSHTTRADAEERAELEAERDRARQSQGPAAGGAGEAG